MVACTAWLVLCNDNLAITYREHRCAGRTTEVDPEMESSRPGTVRRLDPEAAIEREAQPTRSTWSWTTTFTTTAFQTWTTKPIRSKNHVADSDE